MSHNFLKGIAVLLAPVGVYALPHQALGSYQRSYQAASRRASAGPHSAGLARSNSEPERAERPSSDDLAIQSGRRVSSLVIIDQAVPDKAQFYARSGPDVEVREIASNRDGLRQLKEILSDYRDLPALHLVSHASEGTLRLGSSSVTQASLSAELNGLAALDRALKDGADVFLYGCSLAAGERGLQLLETIAADAHVNVAASSNDTGAAGLGGDWELEVVRGNLTTQPLFDSVAMKDFSSTLAYSGTLALGGMAPGYANKKSYTIPTTTYVFTVKSQGSGSKDLYNYNAGYVYVSTADSLQTKTDVYFGGGEKFNLSQIYVYQGFGAPTKTIRITSDKGGVADSTTTVAASLGTNITMSGAQWTDITRFTIQYSDNTAMHWVKIDNIAISNLRAAAPSITTASIPNAPMKVNDSVTATISVSSDADDYTTGSGGISGTIGGFSLGNLSKVNNSTYTAQFTVSNGGTDVAAGSSIPISITLTNSSGSSSSAFTTPIAQSSDSIDANLPTISSVSIPNSAFKIGDTVTTSITAGEAGLSLNSGSVNGLPLSGLTDNGGGNYSATFTVLNGGTDRAAGDNIPVSLVLNDAAGNLSATYTTAISQNADSIDANAPTISNVSIPNAAIKVGDAVTVSITAGEAGLSLASGSVNGVAVTGFTDNGGGNYSATYTVVNGGTDRATGDTVPVSFVLRDNAGNVSATYSTAIAQSADSIDANLPTISTVSIPNAAVKVGDAVTVSITAGEAGLSLASGSVNGVAVSGFADNGGGNYSATYTVVNGGTDRAAGDDIPVSFVLSDSAGNLSATYATAISQNADSIDANAPSIAGVSIPNAAIKVGDAVIVTITASEAGLNLGSGSVNGVAVTGFTDNGGGSYSATYTVVNGGTDRAAGDSIPVSFVLQDAGGNPTATYTTAIAQSADSIDANLPTISTVSIPNAALKVGDTTTVSITAGEAGLSLASGSVNGVAVTGFTDNGGGSYSATYTVVNGGADRAAGDPVPVSFVLLDSAGNASATYSAAITQNADSIDANLPAIANVSIPNAPINVGDAVTVSITAGEAGLSLSSGTVNGVAVSGFTDNGGGGYSATYAVVNGGIDRAAGDDIPVSFVLSDAAGNLSATYSTAISQNADSIDANAPMISAVSIPNAPIKVGDAVLVSIAAGETGLSLNSGSINGVAVTGFSDNGGGNYSATYTVVNGGVDRTAGEDIPVVFVLSDGGGATSGTYTTPISQNMDSIDANLPAIASVSIPDAAMKVGDVVAVSISASEAGLSLVNGSINGVTVEAFSDNGGGSYSASYSVDNGGIDRAAAAAIPVSFVVSDAAGNHSTPYTAAISQASDPIDANNPGTATGTLTVNENASNATVVGTASASDAVNYLLTNDAGGRFAIDASGQVSVANGSLLDAELSTSHSITIRALDAAGNASETSLAVTVLDINEPPSIDLDLDNSSGASGNDYAATYPAASSGAALSDADAVITDPDAGAQISSASIALSSVLDGDFESISIPSVTGGAKFGATNITVTYTDLAHVQLSGVDSASSYLSAIAAVRYVNAAGAAATTAGTRAVSVSVSDGALSSNTAVASIHVSKAPVVDLDGDDSSGAVGTGYLGAFSEGSSGVAVSDIDSTITDDQSSLQSMRIVLSNPLDAGSESIDIPAVANGATVPGTAITANYAGGTQIDLSGSDSQANYLLALRAVRYTNSSNNPNSTSRLVTVTATDTNGDVGPASTATLGITAVNNPPTIAEGAAITVNMDEDGSPTAFALTLNAADVDSAALTWSIGSQASHGNANATGTGASKMIAYVPFANFNGSDTFNVQVADGSGGFDSIVVTVQIAPQPDSPVITQGASSTVNMSEDGSPLPFALTLNATDPDADSPLTWSISSPATNGMATAVGSGSSQVIGYTPNADFSGSDAFTVRVADGSGLAAIHVVTVIVGSRNDAPVITEGASSLVVIDEDGIPTAFNLTLNATDADNDPINWSITAPASNGSAAVSGAGASKSISYTPAANFNGADSFQVGINDGQGGTAVHTVNVSVSAVNDAPSFAASNPAASQMNASAQSIVGWARDFSPGPANEAQQSLVQYLVSQVSNPTLFASGPSVDASGTLSYLAAANSTGSSTFTVQVQDNGGTANSGVDLSTAQVFTITIERGIDSDGVPDPVEAQVPNAGDGGSGDGNGDGIPDAEQSGVTSTRTSQGDGWVTIFNEQGLEQTQISVAPAPSAAPPGINFPYGIVDFTVAGLSPGGKLTMTLLLDYNPAITGYMKFNYLTGKWETINSIVTQVGTRKTQIVFELTDGDAYDGDRTANGSIVDPGGPVIAAGAAGVVRFIPTLNVFGIGVLMSLFALFASWQLAALRRR